MKERLDWENQRVTQKNREPMHSPWGAWESAEEAVQGPFFDNMVLGIDSPHHQSSLWLFQPPDQLTVAGLDFLLVLS